MLIRSGLRVSLIFLIRLDSILFKTEKEKLFKNWIKYEKEFEKEKSKNVYKFSQNTNINYKIKKDSQNLIQELENKNFPLETEIFSCDFSSLYTNIGLVLALNIITDFI